MHQALQGATFHLEHIVPRSRGGDSTLDNLAWACPACNLRKSDRVKCGDPQTHALVRLFNPRRDIWTDQFQWNGHLLVPLTDIGRATLAALDLNNARRLRIRRAEATLQLFPP
jgi:hypothetical protein